MPKKQIPLLDLKRQYSQIGDNLEQKVLEVLRSSNYILGQNLTALESAIAGVCNCAHAVGVANGTDALVLALWALDIGIGDEVITSPFTFAATAEAIVLRGAKPVFVDINPQTFNLNPGLIESALSKNTKAILPVHLYGQPADMNPILTIAKSHQLWVIEDNAQAIGARYHGRPTGCLGDIASISFYPTKNLGACGDAGMLVTNHVSLAERLRSLRAHGARRRYFHDELGVNSRLDEVQAAILLAKLPYLNEWNKKRSAIAQIYSTALNGCPGIATPQTMPEATHVWHQYTIRITGNGQLRQTVQAELASHGIGSMCYYPIPLHMQPAFLHLGYKKGDLPCAEAVAEEVLSLPMYPELTGEETKLVAETLREIMTRLSVVPMPAMSPVPVILG